MAIIIGIIVILLLVALWKFFSQTSTTEIEGYRACRDCSDYRMPRNGMLVLNPFVWPYSGTSCVDDLYILNKESGLDLGFNSGPLTHLNTPDHIELVGQNN